MTMTGAHDDAGPARRCRARPLPPLARPGAALTDPVVGPADPADMQSAFDNAPIAMAVVTPLGVITTCNPALGLLIGRDPRSMLGATLFDVTHPDDRPDAYRKCALMRAGATQILRHECRFLRADETVIWVLVSTSRVPEVSKCPAHLIMHIEDITARKALEAELTRRALHDPLTGLPNRALLLDRIAHALARSRRSSRPTCLFFLDFNGFKHVNDTHGHAAGDLVLQQFAQRLTALLRPGDSAARLGGDEFTVLCEDLEPSEAEFVAQRLRAAAADPFTVHGHQVQLTAAVGISTSIQQSDTTDPATLLQRADQHMYRAKRGRLS